MRWVPLDNVTDDMVLAHDVVLAGRKLARGLGPPPPPDVMRRFGVLALPVDDAWSRGIEPVTLFGDPNRLREHGTTQALAVALAEEVFGHGRRAVLPFPYPGYDRWSAVTAALVAAATAFAMGLPRGRVEDAAHGALLHLLGDQGEAEVGDNMLLRGILAQIGERPDGRGPRGLGPDEVFPPAKAAAAGVAFARYVFEEGASPGEALEAVWADIGSSLFPEVRGGFENVVLYPPGAEVLLSDGARGLVVKNHAFDVRRPLVRLPDGEQVDLARTFSLVIVDRRG